MDCFWSNSRRRPTEAPISSTGASGDANRSAASALGMLCFAAATACLYTYTIPLRRADDTRCLEPHHHHHPDDHQPQATTIAAVAVAGTAPES